MKISEARALGDESDCGVITQERLDLLVDAYYRALDVVVAAKASQSPDLNSGDHWLPVMVPQSKWSALREALSHFEED